MTRKVFENSMVAHVWAQRIQDSGRSNNGQFYFEGAKLYSYGTHFVAGVQLAAPFRAFLNANSYSVTTSRHMSHARQAARGSFAYLHSLTHIADFLIWADKATTKAEKRQHAKTVISQLIAHEDDDRRALVSVFDVLGYTGGEAHNAALRVISTIEKNKKEAKEAEDKRAEKRLINIARKVCAMTSDDLVSCMMQTTKTRFFRANRASEEWTEKGKEIFRAAKVARAKGWTRMAATCSSHHKTIRNTIVIFDVIERAQRERETVSELIKSVRKGLNPMLTHDGYQWRTFATACREIVNTLYPYEDGTRPLFRRYADIMGVDVLALKERLETLETQFTANGARDDMKRRHAKRREQVTTLRQYRAYVTGEIELSAELAAKLAGYAASVATSNGAQLSRYYSSSRAPGAAFRIAGFTADHMTGLHNLAKAHAAHLNRVIAAESLAAWREGAPTLPRDVHGKTMMTDGRSGAMLRAVDVKRDDSGAITGGVLETSQGAHVPLTHALRAFAFLRQCRARGKGWRANGKTVRVGHFTIDSIDAQGNFVAGCHRINWGEVSKLAERLGVADLAPADATEERAHA